MSAADDKTESLTFAELLLMLAIIGFASIEVLVIATFVICCAVKVVFG